MKKSTRFIGAALLAWAACAVAAAQSAQPQMSEQVFKNVQVLKGLPVDQFMGTMGLFAAALSADCSECHTGAGTADPKWEEDTPKKRTARRMIQMMQAINADNFNGRQQVTCWTCHRGVRSPSVTRALDSMYGEPIIDPADVVARATSGEPTADEIFDKYIKALGGADRLAALKSYAITGKSTPFGEAFGKSYPMELYAQAPNRLVTLVHEQEGDMARSFDGATGYFLLPLTVVQEYPWTGGAAEGAKLDAEMAFPAGIRNYLTNWRVGFSETINDKDVRVVQGTGASGLLATFYFDKETGLLSRMVRYFNSPVGRVPVQIDYAEYKAAGGVMIPSKWSYAWLSGRDEFVAAEIQPNAPIDPAKFGKPTPVSRAIK